MKARKYSLTIDVVVENADLANGNLKFAIESLKASLLEVTHVHLEGTQYPHFVTISSRIDSSDVDYDVIPATPQPNKE